MTPSAPDVGLPPRPWNISCSNATLLLSPHCSTLTALRPGHHNTRPDHHSGGLRHPSLLATYCPSPYLCLLEEDWSATTPMIPTQDYPGAHKDPKVKALWILMSPGVVLCGYHRHGSWPFFLKKAKVRQRTAGCQEGWTPEAARNVDMSSVMMARVESREHSAEW
ncbi:hypothetical protein E2C01_059425 [Portunus trituberculatus]|uniref:Uncharacterized protein n=1 Tax=Portunus trituberculatus TaxID=210409 RepID=A0A5B7H2I5_PORTR|nr:hypothetical protein [Portunus trituberculatus]